MHSCMQSESMQEFITPSADHFQNKSLLICHCYKECSETSTVSIKSEYALVLYYIFIILYHNSSALSITDGDFTVISQTEMLWTLIHWRQTKDKRFHLMKSSCFVDFPGERYSCQCFTNELLLPQIIEILQH